MFKEKYLHLCEIKKIHSRKTAPLIFNTVCVFDCMCFFSIIVKLKERVKYSMCKEKSAERKESNARKLKRRNVFS